jgi:endoglucanase
VGDRLSIFSPRLTDSVAKRAEEIAGGASSVTASQKLSDLPAWRWQRKLMAGGACEASVFCAYAYECTCVCLPLGNYHNMGNLDAVQKGERGAQTPIEREFIGVDDFHGLIDLLVACGRSLPEPAGVMPKIDTLWNQRAFVLSQDAPPARNA